MVALQDVRKVYNAGRPNEFAALRGVSLQIDAGTTTVLQGPSGSGKTTLLSIIGCMARPTAGRVFLFGQEVTSLPERFLTEIRRETSGVIFQHFNLIRGVTCLENVMFPGYVTGESHRSLKARAMEILARFRLEEKAASRVEWLSGGELQRVAIARALINDPPLLLADEPTAHLDSALAGEFLAIAAGLRAQGKTLIIASHDPVVVEAGLVDRVIRIHDGAVVDGGEAGP